MMRRLTRPGVQWAWIVLAAAASLLSAAGYLLFTAFRFAQDAPTLLGGLPERDGLAEPDGLAKQAAAVVQFRGHIPALLVLLAVMLLTGCLVLTGALPTTVRLIGGGNGQLAGRRRLRTGLLVLAAVAGLFALTYAGTAALALTFNSPLIDNTPERSFLQSNSITALAISLAALALLAPVFLSQWAPGPPPASPAVQHEQDRAAASPTRRPAPETMKADAPQTPPSSPPDLIEGPPRLDRGR
jgi:hypothetical protein